jgi:hypothetical protein
MKIHGYSAAGSVNRVEFEVWRQMLRRCYASSYCSFAHYGARGIVVSERWRESFANFLSDMGGRPPGCTLDRIDNDGPYSAENCRWATWTEQQNNKRNNVRIKFRGRTLTVREWERELGFSNGTIKARLGKHGWSPERALSTPVRPGNFRRKP